MILLQDKHLRHERSELEKLRVLEQGFVLEKSQDNSATGTKAHPDSVFSSTGICWRRHRQQLQQQELSASLSLPSLGWT